jgi:hypothetical protein
VLKFVETDPEYSQLLDACLAEIAAIAEPLNLGMDQRESFIFVSSPGSVTPYHIDPECNFLLQIRGRKTVHQFPAQDRSLITEEELEQFFAGGHRNLKYREEFADRAQTFLLQPGEGLHFPVAAPHWVQNEDEVSISYSITFRTRQSLRRCAVHRFNAGLRRWGWTPTPVGRSPWRDELKYQLARVGRRLRRLAGGRESCQ